VEVSADPTNWTAVANSPDIWLNAIAYGNNRFVAVGYDGEMAYSDDNGVTWTAVADSKFPSNSDGGDGGSFSINAIAYGNNRFVAVGDNGKMAYSDDGISWTAVSDSKFPSTDNRGYSFQIGAIAYGNNRFVAGGNNDKMAYSDNGASWTVVAESVFTDMLVRGIAYGNNRFVAVGYNGKMAYADW
jgi:photosystem II stability/assembly factor-like uncharacterized protein